MTGREEDILKYKEKTLNTVSEMPDYISDYYYSLTGLQESSRYIYITFLRNFLEYIAETKGVKELSKVQLGMITDTDIGKYMEHLEDDSIKTGKKGRCNIMTRMAAIKRFFGYLAKKKIIPDDPSADIKYKKNPAEHTPVYLTTDEVRELFTKIEDTGKKWKTRDKLLFYIPLVTGMRVTPLREINLSDINFTDQTIQVTEKENFKRTFQLDDNSFAILKSWIKERKEILGDEKCDALFIAKRDGQFRRISNTDIHYIYKVYTKDFNKNIPPHGMRRTFANIAYEASGHDIYMVSNLLGHKQIDTTRKYVAADSSRKKEMSGKIFSMIS